MTSDMFEGLSPEVTALLQAAASELPTAQADAGLLQAMASAVSLEPVTTPVPTPRRKTMLGKALTAKALAIAGVLALSGGVASAATGTLPDPAQDAASGAVSHVGLHIPKSDKAEKKEHPENHGKDVSTVAHDPANAGAGHGAAVCAAASEDKCKAGDDSDDGAADDSTGDHGKSAGEKGKSADHRQDGDHKATTDDNDSVESPDDDSATTDVSGEDADDDAADHESKDKAQDHPDADDHPSAGGDQHDSDD